MGKALLTGIAVSLLLSSAAWAKIGGGDIAFKVKEAGNVVYTNDFSALVVLSHLQLAA